MSVELLTAIGGIIAGISGFFIGKRKRSADAQKTEMDAVEQAVKIWRELAQDLKKEVEELREQVVILQTENRELHSEIDRLKERLND